MYIVFLQCEVATAASIDSSKRKRKNEIESRYLIGIYVVAFFDVIVASHLPRNLRTAYVMRDFIHELYSIDRAIEVY